MLKTDLVACRAYNIEDKNFILATMLRSLYYSGSVFSEMRKQAFMENYHKVVEHLLQKNEQNIKISCLKEDPGVILGYSILDVSGSILHFIFVKKSWRTIGIAKDLVPSTVKFVTHLTKTGLSIAKNKGLEYQPFLI